jgi:DNA-binding CsgD family transcriptional regulator
LVQNILAPFVREVSQTLPSGKRSFRTALWNSYPGNVLIGSSLFIFSAVTDMTNSLLLHYPVSFSRYGLCAFVLAVAFMLARLYGKMSRELAEKSALLEKSGNPAVAREAVFKAHGLTDREKEVARLMTEGLDNETIASQLFVSASTVAFHIKNIYRKFGIEGKNRERAAFVARVLG